MLVRETRHYVAVHIFASRHNNSGELCVSQAAAPGFARPRWRPTSDLWNLLMRTAFACIFTNEIKVLWVYEVCLILTWPTGATIGVFGHSHVLVKKLTDKVEAMCSRGARKVTWKTAVQNKIIIPVITTDTSWLIVFYLEPMILHVQQRHCTNVCGWINETFFVFLFFWNNWIIKSEQLLCPRPQVDGTLLLLYMQRFVVVY